MKKFFIFLSLSIFAPILVIRPMELVQAKQRWLILGAGTENDTAAWNEYAHARGAEWDGFNIQGGPHAIVGDFNKPEDLDKLHDDVYDKIFFDWSTTKFVHDWDMKILSVLYKKLKDQGELLIRTDGMRSSGQFFDGDSYESYVLACEKHLRKDALTLGTNYFSASSVQCNERMRNAYMLRYNRENMCAQNVGLLQTVFGNNVQLRINKPHPDQASSSFFTTHYRALKSQVATVAQGDEIDKSPYSNRIGEYTIRGRYYFPTNDDMERTLCLVDADHNIYYVQYPEPSMTYRTLLAFMNRVLGKEFTQLYLSGDRDPRRNAFVNLDREPMMGYEHLGLDGAYGEDIPWHENPFELNDVPLIEHAITRDQLPENTPLPKPVRQETQRRLTLLERILKYCSCCRRQKVKLM